MDHPPPVAPGPIQPPPTTGGASLASRSALLVGMGGLGSPVALMLAAAGIGRLVLVDGDRVELSNLGRQVIHTTPRVGMAKVESAAVTLRQLRPDLELELVDGWVEEENAAELAASCDLVLDGCDNFDTRYLVNQGCRRAGRPLVSGAVVGMEGQVALFLPQGGAPCYRCLYPRQPRGWEMPTCATAGVLAPLPGLIGALMALEAVKYLTGVGESLASSLLLINARDGIWHRLRITADPDCPVCGAVPREFSPHG